ncbi:MAG: hypothetical protein GY898_30220 [Proteobacteria bacterium]|nr:hypothetical protein [Pseudomonadota bacterium]
MKLIAAAAATFVLATGAALPTVDLDGDGKPEKIARTEEVIKLADGEVMCGGFDFPCDVIELDVRTSDAFKELLICEHGPRDYVTCGLWTVRDGKPVEIAMKTAAVQELYVESASSTGGGFLLAVEGERFWKRVHKFILSTDGRTLRSVPQPYFHVDTTFHIDRTFPITMEPDGGTVVANVRPDSDIQVLLEHGSKRGVFLVRISSGLTGWTTMERLTTASDYVMMMMSAG